MSVYQLAACLAYSYKRPRLNYKYAFKTFLRTRKQKTKQDSPQCVTNTVISYFLSCPQKQPLRHHTAGQEWRDMPGMPALGGRSYTAISRLAWAVKDGVKKKNNTAKWYPTTIVWTMIIS